MKHTRPTLLFTALSVAVALGVPDADAAWAVQLGSGALSTLESEQQKLGHEQGKAASLIPLDGQYKLVIIYQDKLEALSALRLWQSRYPSAFVRQLPSDQPPAVPQPKAQQAAPVAPSAVPARKTIETVPAVAKPSALPKEVVSTVTDKKPLDFSKLTVSNRLPGPIAPDDMDAAPAKVVGTVKQEIQAKPDTPVEKKHTTNDIANTARASLSPKALPPLDYWAVQLGSGSESALQAQAKQLSREWPDARVVSVEGKPKLVVGKFQSPGEAAASLLALKRVNVQAFVRKIPAEGVMVSPAAEERKTATAVTTKPLSTSRAPQSPAQEALPVTESALVAASPVVDPKPTLPTEPVEVEEKLDTLPAIVAVAAPIQEAPPIVVMTLTPEEQAMQDAADMVDGESTQDRGNRWWRTEAPVESREVVVPEVIVEEKKNMALPLREKRLEIVTRQPSSDRMPIDLMLSPLYLLPQDGAKAKETDLTMQSLSETLQNSSLAKLIKGRDAPPEAGDKEKLIAKLVGYANERAWLKALPLAKAAESLDTKQFTSADHLLLGWVWLQNQLPEKAKKYFSASLKARAQDDARYGLALSYVMMNDKRAAFNLYQQMAPSAQKSHLKTML